MKRYVFTIFTLAASALLLSSCAKDLGGNGSANGADSTPLSFSTSTEGTLDVKGTPATTVTSFTAAGYSGSTEWFPAQAVNTTDKYSSHKWKSGTSYTFYGYANMPSSTVATAAIASTGVTLTYKAVPTDASAQNDILLGHYSGNGGGTGTAAMTFYHPLSQVVFTVGDIKGISKITSISITGVYSAGKVGFSVSDSAPAYNWSDCSGSATVSQTVTGYLPAKDAQIGVPFILIPQDFTSPAKIKIQMSAKTTAGEDQVIIAELTGITLEAGKKTVLAVSYSAQHDLNFTASVTAWDATEEQEMDLEEYIKPAKLSGVFQVNAQGKKVSFSRGNLWCDYNAKKWYFEKEQTNLPSKTYNPKHVSYFWYDGPKSLYDGEKSYFGAEEYCERIYDPMEEAWIWNRGYWGTSEFAIEDAEGLEWYCLSYDEWDFVIDNTSRTRGYANNTPGFFFFPDSFVWDESKYGEAPKAIIKGPVSFHGFDDFFYVSGQHWSALEKAGVVFLATLGNGTDMGYEVLGYWYYDSLSGDESWRLDSNINFDIYNGEQVGYWTSYSVRLVTTVTN